MVLTVIRCRFCVSVVACTRPRPFCQNRVWKGRRVRWVPTGTQVNEMTGYEQAWYADCPVMDLHIVVHFVTTSKRFTGLEKPADEEAVLGFLQIAVEVARHRSEITLANETGRWCDSECCQRRIQPTLTVNKKNDNECCQFHIHPAPTVKQVSTNVVIFDIQSIALSNKWLWMFFFVFCLFFVSVTYSKHSL